jgi:hypothetical protein
MQQILYAFRPANMKPQSYLIILILGLVGLLSNCNRPIEDGDFQPPTDAVKCTKKFDELKLPDFETCNCIVADTMVCGEDGRIYTSECLAECLGVAVVKEGPCDSIFRDECDPLTWEIEKICFPIPTPDTPEEIRHLGDGTVVYKHPTGFYFRGTVNRCICLHPETMIATFDGEKEVRLIKEGDWVWSLNECGEKELQPVLWVSQAQVPATHQLLKITLKDGRQMSVSPLHPDIKGKPLKNLTVGSFLNGSPIVSIDLIPANIPATWDILPAGTTGTYFANGIAIGSTLKEFYQPVEALPF